mgnify:CR=1 FL=1
MKRSLPKKQPYAAPHDKYLAEVLGRYVHCLFDALEAGVKPHDLIGKSVNKVLFLYSDAAPATVNEYQFGQIPLCIAWEGGQIGEFHIHHS